MYVLLGLTFYCVIWYTIYRWWESNFRVTDMSQIKKPMPYYNDGPYRNFKSTGIPKGWSEVPQDFMLYMLVRAGKVLFVSAGKDIFPVAAKLQKKYKADRVLYMPTSYLNSEETVAALIAHYQPPYNFKTQSAQLAELDALLSEAEN